MSEAISSLDKRFILEGLMDNVSKHFHRSLLSHSTKTAVISGEKVYSYGQLAASVKTIYKWLKPLVEKKTTIVLVADYSLKSISAFVALWYLKKTIVPIIPSSEAELSNKLKAIDGDLIIRLDQAENFKISVSSKNNRDVGTERTKSILTPNSSGLVLFSSGSTGEPKVMVHNLDSIFKNFSHSSRRPLKVITFLLFDHIGGLNTLLGSLFSKNTIVIPNSREPQVISKLIEEFGIQILPTSPTFLNQMVIHNVFNVFDLSSLRLVTYGTEKMPSPLLKRLKLLAPKTRFLQTFGTSETGIIKTQSLSSNSTWFKISDTNVKHKIIDGELWLKTTTQISGYLNADNSAFSRDGWFKTGDVVETKSDGYMKVIGRKKQIINVGGEKVLPEEIEEYLFELDFVDDCLVFPIENPVTGYTVGAQIKTAVTKSNLILKKRIRDALKQHLSEYKLPTKIEIVDEIKFGSRYKKQRKVINEREN